MTDQSGAALEPAIGDVPVVVDETPPGVRPPLWPAVPRPVFVARVVIGVVLSVAALYAPLYFEPAMNRVLSQAIYLAIAAMGLNLLTGFNGQVSIGHGAFFGVGAFTTAILMVDHGWTFEPTILVAALLSAAVGVVVGIPALRVRGLYLALVTLGLAVLFPRIVQKFVEGTGGVALLRPPRSDFESLISGLDDDQWAYFLSLVIMVVLFVLAWNLVRGRIGRAMIAVRDQEIAATTVGVNLAGTKVATFAISAAYAGVAGSLSVMVDRIADGTNPILYFQLSIEFLVADGDRRCRHDPRARRSGLCWWCCSAATPKTSSRARRSWRRPSSAPPSSSSCTSCPRASSAASAACWPASGAAPRPRHPATRARPGPAPPPSTPHRRRPDPSDMPHPTTATQQEGTC